MLYLLLGLLVLISFAWSWSKMPEIIDYWKKKDKKK